jgi:hypothetical protein
MDKFTYGNNQEAIELIDFLNTLEEEKENPRKAEQIRRSVSALIHEYNRVIKVVLAGLAVCNILDTREYHSAGKSCFHPYYSNVLDKIRQKPWRSFIKTRVFAFVRQTAKQKNLL